MIEILKYPFMMKALLVGVLIGICASLLGNFLVLRKQSMIGDGLAHVSFAAVAISLLIGNQPLLFSIPIVIFASFLILKLSENEHWNADAAIGMVSSFAISLGVIISSLNKGFSVDLLSYLFGSILVIKDSEVIMSLILGLLTLVIVVYFYRDLFALTYDEDFCVTRGLPVNRLKYLLAVLTSITVVLGIRIVGTMLISAMIVFPTVSSLQISKSFKSLIINGILISTISVLFGVVVSFYLNLPTGAAIVMMHGILFVVTFFLQRAVGQE